MDFLNSRQLSLFAFVQRYHAEQKRKYTGDPYVNHLISVAKIVSEKDGNFLYLIEIALCHDLFEDTLCQENDLFKYLSENDYHDGEAASICNCVKELTDEFTKDKYPALNRAERKLKESERLSGISKRSQTVKYADLIDNSRSILKHDINFAKVYLQEMNIILSKMRNGDFDLYVYACHECYFNYQSL